MRTKTSDLTNGILWKQILIFAIPLALSNFLQEFFNISDIAVVGRFAGRNALGAVGSTTTLITFYIDFFVGVSSGINVLTAVAIGSHDKKNIRETVHTSAIISVILGVILMITGIIFSGRLLTILNTKDELLASATLYIRVYLIGLPATAIYNYGSAVLSAAGNTRKPLIFLTISGIVNILLNLLFVTMCKMDVLGVALASVISQYLSAFLITNELAGTNEAYALRFKYLRLTRSKVTRVIKLSLPAGFQYAIFCIANLFVQGGVNSFSATVVEGNAAAANADLIVYGIMAAFYTACTSFMGQNIGAGHKKRVKQSYIISVLYAFTIALILGVILVLTGKRFLSLFTNDSDVICAGMERLTVMGFSYCISAFMDCTIAASRAFGKTAVPTILVIAGSCVFRIIWIFTVFSYFRTTTSLYLLYAFSWIITATVEILYFVYIYKNSMKKLY